MNKNAACCNRGLFELQIKKVSSVLNLQEHEMHLKRVKSVKSMLNIKPPGAYKHLMSGAK